MTAKAEKSPDKAAETIPYDASATQIIPQTIDGHRVHYVVSPLSDERYFQFEKSVVTAVKRAKKLATALYEPKQSLFKELCTELRNYPESFGVDEVDQAEAVCAMNALLHVEILAADEEAKDGPYNPKAPKTIEFRAMFGDAEGNGRLMSLSHSFRPDTKAERDEFLSIETDQPNENLLASLDSSTKAEKLARLGAKLLVDHSGYAEGSRVPAWHLAQTTESFFARQIGKMGSSLVA